MQSMPDMWMVTVNGVPLFKGFTSRKAAELKAEKWQGSRYKGGLLKHKDYGDHVEVKHDTQAERQFDQMYADAKAGKPQRTIMEEYLPD